MGGLLPQEYLYYSEHTVAPGQGELNLKLCALRNTCYAAAFYILAHISSTCRKNLVAFALMTQTLTYRTNRSEGVLHP